MGFMAAPAIAQNPHSLSTQLEVGIGFVQPYFRSGSELLRAQTLREKGLSYFEDQAGNRRSVGAYSKPTGYQISIGFYKPIKAVKGLMAGALVRNSQTGSTPETAGYEEAYFFNYISAGLAIKYYPLERYNLFVRSDFGLAAVLTKNRYLNGESQQNFFHQFGIGSAIGLDLGYTFFPFRSDQIGLEVKSGYQRSQTRVEVNEIGDDVWSFDSFSLSASIIF